MKTVKIAILEGESVLDGWEHFNRLEKDKHYETIEITDLYSECDNLLELIEHKPQGILICTTGFRVEETAKLKRYWRENIAPQYLPEFVIFGGEEAAMAYLEIARELAELGVKFYYDYGFNKVELHPITWINK